MKRSLLLWCAAASICSFGQILSQGPEGITIIGLVRPTAPTVVQGGTARPGSTTFTYVVVAYTPNGAHTAAGPAGSLTTGAALPMVDGAFNLVTWDEVAGAATYAVYCTAGCSPLGRVGASSNNRFRDSTGIGNGITAPSTDTTKGLNVPGSLIVAGVPITAGSGLPSGAVVTGPDLSLAGNLSVSNAEIDQSLGLHTVPGIKCDGVTNDRAAIQSAIDYAVAHGTVLRLPPGNCLLSGAGTELLLVSGPIIVEGAGFSTRLVVGSSVGASVDVFRLYSASAPIERAIFRDFVIIAQSGTPGRHGITIDTTLHSISGLTVERLYIGILGGRAIVSINPAPLLDGFYTSLITNSTLWNGVQFTNAGDTIQMIGNVIPGSNQVAVSLLPGALKFLAKRNNITTSGGSFHITGGMIDSTLEDNEIEGQIGNTGSNGASIDIDCTVSEPCSNIHLVRNYVAPVDTNVSGVRVNYASDTTIESGKLIRAGPGTVDVLVTANATNTRLRNITISPANDTIQGILLDSGTGTEYDLVISGKRQMSVPVNMAPGGTAPACASYTLSGSQLTAASTAQNVSLFTLPAGAKIMGVTERLVTAFSGSGLTTLTMTVGDLCCGTTTYVSSAFDLMAGTFADTQVFKSGLGFTDSTVVASVTANHNLNTSVITGSAKITACWVQTP